MVPTFLHLCCNPQCADREMNKADNFLRFSRGYALSRPSRLIKTDDLTHIFKTTQFLNDHRLDGMTLVGAEYCDKVKLNPRQIDYLEYVLHRNKPEV